MNNRFHSPYVTAAAIAAIPGPSRASIDSEASTLAKTAAFNDPGRPRQVAEVNDDREWEIHDIIGKEVVGGVVHYWVQWEATLLPVCELPRAKVLVEEFEARLRGQARQKDSNGKGQKNVKARQHTVGACNSTQQKRLRGRLRKRMPGW